MSETQPTTGFSELTQISGIPAGALVGFPVEQILVRRGVLDADKLQQAELLAEERAEPLEDVLLSMKAITEEDLLYARSEQLDIPYGDEIDPKEIPAELLDKLSISFSKQALILPLSLEDGLLTVACADPYDVETFDQIRMLLQAEPIPLLYSKQALLKAINQTYDLLQASFGFEDAHDELEEVGSKQDDEFSDIGEAMDLLDASDDEAPVIRLVNALIYRAMKERASDIHIEPFEKEVVVRFRIDGILSQVTTAPKRAQSHIVARIKIMSQLDIAEKRLPQDGKIRLKIAGKDLDLRVSTIPTAHGERCVLRLLDKSNVLLDLSSIGFSRENLDTFEGLISRSHGIILVTGPTGSGKTTTLYSALSRINSPDKNILTVEDPVEYQLKGIGQMQVNSKIKLTFSSGLRAFLRQDPDVILVGETRDAETAEIAIQ
ncbi:MAG TPA: type II secretion system protein GspE, partial [Myxococcales bacterium]|nr:type II secretion system protein GspE [Myxococcales bacterium]